MSGRLQPRDYAQKYAPVSIHLNPRLLARAKRDAKRRDVGYQTLINETLIKASA